VKSKKGASDQTSTAKDFMKQKVTEARKSAKDFGTIDENDKSNEQKTKLCESASTFISTMRMGKKMKKELHLKLILVKKVTVI
jgi:hypothetical protein